MKTKRKTYGNTWWGQAWVHALEQMDAGRLSRGKTLANTSRVLDVVVQEHTVYAQVKGSYHDTYKVEIKSALLLPEDQRIVQDLIAEQASMPIELAMGQLPVALLTLLAERDIHLLPRHWDDLKIRCTCPDAEMPCKHLASVCYLLANEIDKDPLILLSLKGISCDGWQVGAVPSVLHREHLLAGFLPVSQGMSLSQAPEKSEFLPNLLNFPVRNVQPLLALLPDHPSFYAEGNFKHVLETVYKAVPVAVVQLYLQRQLSHALGNAVFQLEYFKDAYNPRYLFQWKITIDPSKKTEKERIESALTQARLKPESRLQAASLPQTKLHKDQARLWIDDAERVTEARLRSAFSVEPVSLVFDYFLSAPLPLAQTQNTTSVSFWSAVAATALALVKARWFLPELIQEAEQAFVVRYRADVQEPLVQNALTQLQAMMPPDCCHYGELFLPRDAVTEALNSFVTYLVHQALKSVESSTSDKLMLAFTRDYLYRANRFTEKNSIKSLSHWLERLQAGKRDLAPQIRIEQFDDGLEDQFQVYVDVIHRKRMMEQMVPYAQLFMDDAQLLFSDASDGNSDVATQALWAQTVQLDVSRQLMIAAQYMDQLREIVDSRGQIAPVVNLLQLSQLLLNTAGILDILGFGLILPKELKKLAYPDLQVKAKLNKSQDTGASYLSLEGMLEFSYEVALGDETISPDEFDQLVRQSEGLVKFKDQYILLKPEDVQQLLQKLSTPFAKFTSPMQALYTAILGRVHGLSFQPDEALERVVAEMLQVDEVAIPSTLNAVLRPYQERGFRWLWSNSRKGFGSCIADDMGLGKTIQVLTVLLQARQDAKNTLPSLVVCPTTLIGNWEKECQRFAPSLRLNIYHGNERQLVVDAVDVVITSYGTFRRDFQQFSDRDWEFLIIDEAQNIKNSTTAQTQVIKALKSKYRIAMTGTPVENRLTELWNIFDFINPGYLGTISQFKTRLANPIEKAQDQESVVQLKKVTAPFILRRLKTDKTIISDLPEKVTFDEYCYLTKEQAAVYQNVVETIMSDIESSEGIQRKGLIFKLITALKQICNHPAHYANLGNVASELSGKAAKALSILQTILENNEKALIFTQYREMGNLLQQMMQRELGEEALFFHGGLTRNKRDEMVAQFQTDAASKLMIVSLKAGGTGLNLTEASNVIHYDLWWNPAVENQATDRAYRIGQAKTVVVHRLITLGSFEEKIDEMIKAKKALADLAVSDGESWITQMSNQDLREIFGLFH